jgi:hypothetical protein
MLFHKEIPAMSLAKRVYAASMFSAFLFAGFAYLFLPGIPNAQAIPYFSRKYGTSCTTCHNVFPELNDFGWAFKKNGFKFPQDDQTYLKEPPVLLGAKAQREVFPKAVYPGEIPGTIPVALRYSGFFNYNNRQPTALGFQPRTDLYAPNTLTIISAGSFGQRLSWWIDDDISAGGSGANGGLGDGYLKANDIGHYLRLPKDALNLRFGQFELDLPFSQARTINLSGYDIYDQAGVAGTLGTTNNPFTLGAPQRGVEIGGYPNDGNFTWSLALVNGNNNNSPTNNSKSVYVHVSQQFNLDRDRAARREVQAAGAAGPHDHTSLRIGGFYSYGNNVLNTDRQLLPGFPDIKEPYYRAGGYLRFRFRGDFEMYGLGMFGHDSNLIANPATFTLAPGSPVNFSGGFVQAQYWLYPWVIAIMRYDLVNSATDFLNGAAQGFSRNRFSPGLQILIRANIKLGMEYQYRWKKPVPGTNQFFRPSGFVAGLDFVM